MIDNEKFQGDVLLYDTDDGGDIDIINGLVMPDRGFGTAMYLSIMGGNIDDGGKVDNAKTWWGNRINGTKEHEKIVSRFQSIIKTLPLTTKNLAAAEDAIMEDLDWMKREEIIDEIKVNLKAVSNHRVEIEIVLTKNGNLVEKGNYSANWEALDGI